MKLMNFRRLDPEFTKRGRKGLTRGNKLEEEVWRDYAQDPERLRQTADAIRSNITDARPSGSTEPSQPIDAASEFEAPEARLLTRSHLIHERNRRLVDFKKKDALESKGRLACEACGFDFARHYGQRGKGFIECHHTMPLHKLRPNAVTRLGDLALLCANCHRMVHVPSPWLSIEQLVEQCNPTRSSSLDRFPSLGGTPNA